MADKKGLEIVGVAFGLVTAIVVMVGGLVVKGHFDGRLRLDPDNAMAVMRPLAATSSSIVVR